MAGLSHVALQLALCSNVTSVPPATVEPVEVRMAYPRGEPEFDKTFKFVAGEGSQAFAEFDIRSGEYRLEIIAPKLGCSAEEFVTILPERNRKLVETLAPGPPPPIRPQIMISGTAPISFLYTKPTYVLIDKSVTCDQPVLTPALAPVDYVYDQGAYYLHMYGDPALAATAPVIALRLRTPTGLKHYVRVPEKYAELVRGGWPGGFRLDLPEEFIDEIATDKTDTLLCKKFWETTVH
jgi:hypothetical protein